MTDDTTHTDTTVALLQLVKDKLRVRGSTLEAALKRGRYRMPRRIYSAASRLADAEALSHNPRLRLTLDQAALARDERDVRAFLDDIDPSDERKGWYLGILASLAVNLLTLIVLLIAVLIWRGYL